MNEQEEVEVGSSRIAAVPRIEYLQVKNFRVLNNLELKNLTPLTVFLGPNASGKSTIFDVFAFLSECFSVGLRKAWDKRGRFKDLRSRNAQGPIVFELKYKEPGFPITTYHLELDQDTKGPYVQKEWLRWTRKVGKAGRPFNFLNFEEGVGYALPGEKPSETDARVEERLASRELLAINTLGQFEKHARVSALRRFITGWHLSYLTADSTRGTPEAGPQERLSQTGDNLPNVIQYLRGQHPERLDHIFEILRLRILRLEKVDAELLLDGRLLLLIKDAPFDEPILAKFASDGTLKMLAYLTLLYDPDPPPLIGIEEPENQLHPRLLPQLAEECRSAAGRSQLMITTHSPFFADGLLPEELWVLYRDEKGFTRAKRSADIQGVREFMEEGAQLGQLWMEGHFRVGDPLTNSGMPTVGTRSSGKTSQG
jgi:predicted ATPase